MPLYFGNSEKLKVNANGGGCQLKVYYNASQPDVPDTPTGVYDDTFPIEWNTLAVANNPTVAMSGVIGFVKVSNLTPPQEEMANTVFVATFNGQQLEIPYTESVALDNGYMVHYSDMPNSDMPILVVTAAGQSADGECEFPETGIYVMTDGGDASVDCAIKEAAKTPIAYLYPSVVLPDIESVWTDKETYPYAYILDSSHLSEYLPEDSSGYMLIMSDTLAECNEQGLIVLHLKGGLYSSWYSTDAGWAFGSTLTDETSDVYFTTMSTKGKEVWASADILNTDGTTYLAAFTPIPTSDGMVCYKGAVLPDINAVWTDKETYPYAYITPPTEEAPAATLALFSHAGTFYDDAIWHNLNGSEGRMAEFCYTNSQEMVDALISYFPEAKIGEWFLISEKTLSWNEGISGVVWSSYDVLNTDGTTYLAASEPVPIVYTYDDTFPIEWNSLALENMPVKINLPDGLILTKISNLMPDALAMTGVTLSASVQGEQIPIIHAGTQNVDVGSAAMFGDMNEDIQVLVASITSTDPSADFGGMAAPETGIYVSVYSTVEDGIDFAFDLKTPPKVFFDSFPIDINISGDQAGILSTLETIPLRDENGGTHGSIIKISNMTPSLDELSNVYNHGFSMSIIDGVTNVDGTTGTISSKWDDSGTFVKVDGNSLWVVYEAQTLHTTPSDNNIPVTVDVTPGIYLSDGMVFSLALLLAFMVQGSQNGTLGDDSFRILYGTKEDAENALAEYNS